MLPEIAPRPIPTTFATAPLKDFLLTLHKDQFFCEVTYDITNSGQTPAKDTEQFVDIRLLQWPLPAYYEVKSPTANTLQNKGTINPGQTIRASARKLLTLDVASVRNNQQRLYFVGVLKFTDAFERTRHVRFCGSFENTIELVKGAIAKLPGKISSTFSWGQQHNYAD